MGGRGHLSSLVVAVALALAACTAADDSGEAVVSTTAASTSSTPMSSTTASVQAAELGTQDNPVRASRADLQDVLLWLDSEPVEAVSGTMLIVAVFGANESDRDVVTNLCGVGSYSSGLVRPGDPNAELWLYTAPACLETTTVPAGFRGQLGAVQFLTQEMGGVPLEPGRYLAVVQLEEYGVRLQRPVTVVSG